LFTEPDPDIRCEYDVKIPMSEGFSATTNIFRSKKAEQNGEKVPNDQPSLWNTRPSCIQDPHVFEKRVFKFKDGDLAVFW
jgi:hypothetical protein